MRTGLLATVGSVFLAIAASACCWLPIVLIGIGVSAAGVGTFVAQLRPFLLGFAAVLLALGFYVSYRPRRAECGPDGSCPAPRRPRLQRLGKYGLWFSVLLVTASTLLPRYAEGFMRGMTQAAPSTSGTETLALGIEGMTCAGCERAIETALSRVPGVVAAEVSYDKKQAIVTVVKESSPSRLALATAVRSSGYELSQATGEASNPRPSLAGHWIGEVPRGDGQTPKPVLDLDKLGSRWVGEFDVAESWVENYPVQVELSGSTVKLRFSAANADFEGTQLPGGDRLTGALDFSGQRVAVAFQRIGEAEFSESFLQLEAAADDSSLVERLSASGAELRNRFNVDRDKVRLSMRLAPTWPGCQRGARVVHQNVLQTIDSKKLTVCAVWEPILRTDDARSSRKATMLLQDNRVRHYRVGTRDVGELFQPAIGLTTGPAWDVYLVYPAGREWEGEQPPPPAFLMHQLSGRLPDDRLLDGAVLADRIRRFVK